MRARLRLVDLPFSISTLLLTKNYDVHTFPFISLSLRAEQQVCENPNVCHGGRIPCANSDPGPGIFSPPMPSSPSCFLFQLHCRHKPKFSRLSTTRQNNPHSTNDMIYILISMPTSSRKNIYRRHSSKICLISQLIPVLLIFLSDVFCLP